MGKKKTKKPPSEQELKKARDIDWIKRLLKATENAIDGRSGSIDEFFAQQAERLKKDLAELEKS